VSERVIFYYGIGSRYSYLASTQIEALEQSTGCEVLWRPLYSADLIALRGHNPFAGSPVSGQYEWPYRRADAEAWAEFYGVPFIEPDREALNPRLLARACVAASRLGVVRPFSHALFHAIFADGIVVDEAECQRRAASVGLSEATLMHAMHDSSIDDELRAVAEEAHRHGVFGVPTFIVRDRLFWGNDRLVLVRHYIEQLRKAVP